MDKLHCGMLSHIYTALCKIAFFYAPEELFIYAMENQFRQCY